MAGLPLPKAYQRLGGFAIDENDVFTSLAEMEAYVASAAAYPGHVIALIEGNYVKLYAVQPGNAYKSIFNAGGNLVLDNEVKFTARTYAENKSIPWQAAITLDCSLGNKFNIAQLQGDTTINLSNATPGQEVLISIQNNDSTVYAITLGTGFDIALNDAIFDDKVSIRNKIAVWCNAYGNEYAIASN